MSFRLKDHRIRADGSVRIANDLVSAPEATLLLQRHFPSLRMASARIADGDRDGYSVERRERTHAVAHIHRVIHNQRKGVRILRIRADGILGEVGKPIPIGVSDGPVVSAA